MKHLFLFVYGIYTLLSDQLTSSMVEKADACLQKFVCQMESLYGLPACTFNIHQLIHLSQGVKDCGPLWATSAFFFEANNHMLLKMFQGTRYVPQQITETFMLSRKLQITTSHHFKEETNPAVLHLMRKLSSAHTKQKNASILHGTFVALGSYQPVQLTARQVLAIMHLTNGDVVNRKAVLYKRFVANNQLYTSADYERSKKHHNFDVHVLHSKFACGAISGLVN